MQVQLVELIALSAAKYYRAKCDKCDNRRYGSAITEESIKHTAKVFITEIVSCQKLINQRSYIKDPKIKDHGQSTRRV